MVGTPISNEITFLHILYSRVGNGTFNLPHTKILDRLIDLGYIREVQLSPKYTALQITDLGKNSFVTIATQRAHNGPFKVPGFFK